MSPGKVAAQVAHASIEAYDKANREYIDEWKRIGVTKIVLGVNTTADLFSLYQKAVSNYLPAALVCDEGRTEVTPGTFTCMAIGPAPSEVIDTITSSLPLYTG